MKKIIVPLLIIVPFVFYLKLRKHSKEESKSLKKKQLSSKTTGNKKISDEKESKSKREKISDESNAQCKAITKTGKKCSRKSLPDLEYCWQHSQV